MRPPPVRSVLPLVALLCAAAVFACDDPLGPEDLAGVYVLETVSGESLPALLYTTETVAVTVRSDTLLLRRNGSGRQVRVQEVEALVEGAPEGVTRLESAFGYRVRGGQVEIEFTCGPNALCGPPPHLVLEVTTNGLRAHAGYEAAFPLEYRRTGSGS